MGYDCCFVAISMFGFYVSVPRFRIQRWKHCHLSQAINGVAHAMQSVTIPDGDRIYLSVSVTKTKRAILESKLDRTPHSAVAGSVTYSVIIRQLFLIASFLGVGPARNGRSELVWGRRWASSHNASLQLYASDAYPRCSKCFRALPKRAACGRWTGRVTDRLLSNPSSTLLCIYAWRAHIRPFASGCLGWDCRLQRSPSCPCQSH